MDDPAKVGDAVKLGYRVVTPDQPATLGETASGVVSDVGDVAGAWLRGALQGVSGGLFGAAVGRSKEADESENAYKVRQFNASEMTRQKEAHPVAAGVGELGGMLLSPINKVGALVRGGVGATTALGRIGASALSGGTEGALFGAGNAMSEAALGDQDLTGEKLAAGIGLGGMLGMAGGGVGAGLAEGFKAVAPRVSNLIAGSKGALQDFADNQWFRAAHGLKGDIANIAEADRPAVANVIREAMSPAGKIMPASLEDAAASVAAEREAVAKQLMKEVGVGDAGGLLPKMDKDEALAALDKGFKQNGEKMGEVLERADKLGVTPEFSNALKRFDDLEAGLNPAELDIIEPDIAKARKYIMAMGSAPVGSPKNSFKAMNSLKSTLQDDINWADTGAKNNLKKKLVGIIRDELDSQFELRMGPAQAAELMEAKAAYGALKQAAKAVKGKSATGADAIAALVDNASLASPSLGGKLSALDHASKLIKHGLDKQPGNRFISPSDYAVGIAGGLMNPMGALAALPAAIAHKIIREKGAAVIAKLVDHIVASPRMQIAAASMGSQVQKSAPFLGEYAKPLLQAFAISPANGLATHMTWAKANPDYAAVAQSAGFLPETPEENAHVEVKGNALAAVAHTLDAQNQQIDKHLNAIMKGERAPRDSSAVHSSQDFGAKRMRRETIDSHKTRIGELRELHANPEALVDRVAANMGEISEMAPGVAAAMTKTAHAAVSYLVQESQEPPKAGPLAREWTASSAEIHEFSQKLEAVERPMSVLEHAAAGTLVPAQWKAVQTVYPLLARQIEDMALERLTDKSKDVPYRARMMLSMITGIDVDGSMGQAIALNQDAIANARGKPSEQMPQGDKPNAFTLGARTATSSQRRELSTNEA